MCPHCLCTDFSDLSLTHDQDLESFFEGDLSDNNTPHLASIQAHRAAGWGSINPQITQQEIVDSLEAQGASGSSDPSGSSYTIIADTLSSLSDELDSQFGVQDDYTYATPSRIHEEGAPQSHLVTQGQNAATQASQRKAQKAQEKQKKDKNRKAEIRRRNKDCCERICGLLEMEQKSWISLPPLSECLRIRCVGCIERFIVLERVENDETDYVKIRELLGIPMKPRKTLARRCECLYLYVFTSSEVLSAS